MFRGIPAYYTRSGDQSGVLEACLKIRPDPVYCVRMGIEANDREGNDRSASHRFFSRGDFRQDSVKALNRLMRRFAHEYKEYGVSFVPPADWESSVLNGQKMHFDFVGVNVKFGLDAYSVTRLAEIAEHSWVENPTLDEEGRQVLDKEDFLVESRGSYVDRVISRSLEPFTDVPEIPQPPDDDGLQKMVAEAGDVFDRYLAIPKGSLMVTKDFIFPYVIGRKSFDGLRWSGRCSRHCGYDNDGPRIPTSDVCVHFTGIESEFAPRSFERPVFNANFGFPFDYVRDSFTVPKEDEIGYIGGVIGSMGLFNSVWVPGLPGCVSQDAMRLLNSAGCAAKEGLVMIANEILGIRR